MATIVEEREPNPERILKRIIPYSVGARSFDQGDACFSITAFDDYLYFSLTEEIEGEEVPMNLTSYGSIYLRFKNKDLDISIKAISETQEIDPSRGEVSFKVSAEQSRRIIATDINTFAIVSKLEIGDDKSYENVIFQGKFLKPDQDSDSLSRYDQLYNAEADLTIQNLEAEIVTLRNTLTELTREKTSITFNIDSLSVKFDELDKKYKQALQDLKEAETDSVKKPLQTSSIKKIPAIEIKTAALERVLPSPVAPTNNDENTVFTGYSNTNGISAGRGREQATGGGGRVSSISNTDSNTILRATQ